MRRCRGPLAGELLPHHGFWRGPSLRCGAEKNTSPVPLPTTHARPRLLPRPRRAGGGPRFFPLPGPATERSRGLRTAPDAVPRREYAWIQPSADEKATCGSPRIGTLDEPRRGHLRVSTDRHPRRDRQTTATSPHTCTIAATLLQRHDAPTRPPRPPSTTTRLPARRRCPPRPSSSRPSADRCLHTTCTRSTPRAWAPLPTIKGRPQQRGVRHHATSSPPRPSHPLHPSGPSSMAVMHLAHTASSGGACHVQQQP